jgi:hypothetical protein
VADFIDRLWGGRDGATEAGVPGTYHHWEPAPGDEPERSESRWTGDRLERLADTRRTLHGIAEMLLAGPQHRRSETIRLAVTDTGFKTIAEPDISVDGDDLIYEGKRVPLKGTFAHLADSLDFTAAAPFDVYDEGPDSDPRRKIDLDEDCRRKIIDAFVVGDAALREFGPDQTPVLWPEHFDVSATVGEVTYGVSAGDDEIPFPYAYVAPYPKPTGEFWSYSFGAAAAVVEGDSIGRIVAFFKHGQAEAGL